MSDGFIDIAPEAIEDNPFKLLHEDWTLITAGQLDKFNMMTASWGGLGVLWEKPVATVYVRPQRYTYEFLERETHFSLSFFGEEHRLALQICGAVSGRAANKVQMTALSPLVDEGTGAVYYDEARLVLVLRKLYFADIDPARIQVDLGDMYPEQDYHRLYIGEIVKVLRKP